MSNQYANKTAEQILVEKPNAPEVNCFSSGPTQPILTEEEALEVVKNYHQGSHRNNDSKAKFAEMYALLRETLEIPEGWHIIPINGGDTPAFEALQWECTGKLPVIGVGHENFGHKWLENLAEFKKRENLDFTPIKVGYGEIAYPDKEKLKTSDLQFVPNGTTSGIRYTNFDFIPAKAEREGLVFADVTSFYLTNPLPYDKVNAFTFSMQKAAGSEGGLGFIVCDDATINRINEDNPDRMVPSIMKLRTKDGAYNAALEADAGIANTNSMLVVEHIIKSLQKIKEIGVNNFRQVSEDSLNFLRGWTAGSDWIKFLAKDEANVSNTSPCFEIKDEWFKNLDPKQQADVLKEVNNLLLGKDKENSIVLAKDFGAYKAAPAGFRLWIGGSVPTESVEQVTKCMDWSYALTKQRFVERQAELESKPTLVIADKIDTEELKKLREEKEFNIVYVPEIVVVDKNFKWKDKYLDKADYLLVRSTEITTEDAEKATNLKGIVRGGAGLEKIKFNHGDFPTIERIEVSATKGSNAFSTAQASFLAELNAMGLITDETPLLQELYNARKLGEAKQAVIKLAGEASNITDDGERKTFLAGKKGIKSQFFGDCVHNEEAFINILKKELSTLAKDQKIAVIGAGFIGEWKAKMFNAIGADVTVYNRDFDGEAKQAKKAALEAQGITTKTNIIEACTYANVITVHVEYKEKETKGIINAELVNLAKDGVVIGNYGRPALVEAGVVSLVSTDKVKSYVCDGAPAEVCPIVTSLGDKAQSCEITPHIGAESKESLTATTQAAFTRLKDMVKRAFLTGEVENGKVVAGPDRQKKVG